MTKSLSVSTGKLECTKQTINSDFIKAFSALTLSAGWQRRASSL